MDLGKDHDLLSNTSPSVDTVYQRKDDVAVRPRIIVDEVDLIVQCSAKSFC